MISNALKPIKSPNDII